MGLRDRSQVSGQADPLLAQRQEPRRLGTARPPDPRCVAARRGEVVVDVGLAELDTLAVAHFLQLPGGSQVVRLTDGRGELVGGDVVRR